MEDNPRSNYTEIIQYKFKYSKINVISHVNIPTRPRQRRLTVPSLSIERMELRRGGIIVAVRVGIFVFVLVLGWLCRGLISS